MVVEMVEWEKVTLRYDGAIHPGEQRRHAGYSRVTATTAVKTTAPERPRPASDFGGGPKCPTRTAQQGRRPEF